MAFIEIVKQPLYGSVYWNNIEFVYTPNDGYTGNDSFTYKKTDGSQSILYTKYVNALNEAPIASNASLTANANNLIILKVDDLATDSTNPFGVFQISEISNIFYGKAYTDGQYIYYNAPNTNCVENIIFTVTDNQYNTTGTVTLSIVNAIPDSYRGTFQTLLNNAYNNVNNIRLLSTCYSNSYEFLSVNESYLNSIDPSLWVSMTNFVSTTSGDIQDLVQKTIEFTELYNNLSSNSASWIVDRDVINITYQYNDIFNNCYLTISSFFESWNTNVSNLTSLSSSIENKRFDFINLYNNVSANSGLWDSEEINNILSAENVDKWNEKYDNISNFCKGWNYVYNLTNSFSGFFNQNRDFYNSEYVTLSTKYEEWNNLLSSFRTNLMANSGNWNSVYNNKQQYDNLVLSTDPDWATDTSTATQIHDVITLSSGNWDSSYELLNTKTDKWNSALPLSAQVTPQFPDINLLYTTTSAKSGLWNAHSIQNLLETYSETWNSLYSVMSSEYYTNWNTINDTVTSFFVFYNDNKLIYNSIDANFINYITLYTNTLISILQSNSSNWDDVYNKREDYNNLCNAITSSSGTWMIDTSLYDNIKNHILLNSEKYNNMKLVLDGYSYLWNNASSLPAQILSIIPNLNNIYSIINSYSGKWNPSVLIDILTSNNDSWMYSENLNSSELTNFYQTISQFAAAFSSDLLNFNYTNDVVLLKYDKWNYDPTVLFQTYSSNWEDIYNSKTLYNNAFTVVNTYSGNWSPSDVAILSALIDDNSAKWDYYTNYAYLCNGSLNYAITDTESISSYIINKQYNLNSYFTTVTSNSASWDATVLQGIYNKDGYKWDAVYDDLYNDGIAYAYNDAITLNSTFSSTYIKDKYTFSNLSSTVSTNYNAWSDRTLNDILTSYSDNWIGTTSVLTGLSSGWFFNDKSDYSSAHTKIGSLSTKLINTNSLISGNSAFWSDLINLIPSLSITTNMLTGSDTSNLSSRNLKVTKDSLFYNNLSALGGIVRFDTNLIRLSSFTILNDGTNNALQVSKNSSGFNAITNFKYLSSSVLYVKTETNTVGINVSGNDVVQELTISGDISATGYFDPLFKQTQTVFRSKSASYESTFTFVSSNSGLLDNFVLSSTNYNSACTYVTTTSSDIIGMNTKTYYNNFYNMVASESGLNKSVTDYFTLCSDNIGRDTFFRQNSGKYEQTYNYINSTSANIVNLQYIISHVFTINSNNPVPNQSGLYYIPDDVTILSWTMFADKNTTAQIDILSSYYTNYTRNSSIVGNNPPHLDLATPIKNYRNNLNYNDHWSSDVTKNSILKFVLTTNTLASAITINLKVQKR